MKKYACLILLLICFLGLQDGYLAIFPEMGGKACQVLPYRAALYPKLDQQALTRGIPIHTREELSRLLEDYLS